MGKRPTKFFLSLEKRKARANVLSQAFDKDSTLTSNPKKILELTHGFYAQRYSEDRHEMVPLVDFNWKYLDIPKISEEQREKLEESFSEREFHQALKSLNKDKCPGSDGITVEFYLKFWQLIRILWSF